MEAMSTASCCTDSSMSAFLMTAFRCSDILKSLFSIQIPVGEGMYVFLIVACFTLFYLAKVIIVVERETKTKKVKSIIANFSRYIWYTFQERKKERKKTHTEGGDWRRRMNRLLREEGIDTISKAIWKRRKYYVLLARKIFLVENSYPTLYRDSRGPLFQIWNFQEGEDGRDGRTTSSKNFLLMVTYVHFKNAPILLTLLAYSISVEWRL